MRYEGTLKATGKVNDKGLVVIETDKNILRQCKNGTYNVQDKTRRASK